jgi:hypothetical protein
MAINKKLIHFKTFDTFNSKKLSADETNKTYTIGVNGSVQTGNPDILYQSICYIKDTQQQWTHGQLYSGNVDASNALWVDDNNVVNRDSLKIGTFELVSGEYHYMLEIQGMSHPWYSSISNVVAEFTGNYIPWCYRDGEVIFDESNIGLEFQVISYEGEPDGDAPHTLFVKLPTKWDSDTTTIPLVCVEYVTDDVKLMENDYWTCDYNPDGSEEDRLLASVSRQLITPYREYTTHAYLNNERVAVRSDIPNDIITAPNGYVHSDDLQFSTINAEAINLGSQSTFTFTTYNGSDDVTHTFSLSDYGITATAVPGWGKSNFFKVDYDGVTVNGEQVATLPQVSAGFVKQITNVTYQELVQLRNNNQLIPGAMYRLTDYECTTSQENTASAGHKFDIILTATAPGSLSEECKAVHNAEDGYFDSSNLEAWKIWYSLDNDNNRFGWAFPKVIKLDWTEDAISYLYVRRPMYDTNNQYAWAFINDSEGREVYENFKWVIDDSDLIFTTTEEVTLGMSPNEGVYVVDINDCGKGVIYRMIDENGNDCPYDFKNIVYVTECKGYAINEDIATALSNSTIDDPYFIEVDYWFVSDNAASGTYGSKDEDIIVRLEMGTNPDGEEVPVVYKTERKGIVATWDDEAQEYILDEDYTNPDYSDAFYHVGRYTYNDIEYDMWRKAEMSAGEMVWLNQESGGDSHILTKILTQESEAPYQYKYTFNQVLDISSVTIDEQVLDLSTAHKRLPCDKQFQMCGNTIAPSHYDISSDTYSSATWLNANIINVTSDWNNPYVSYELYNNTFELNSWDNTITIGSGAVYIMNNYIGPNCYCNKFYGDGGEGLCDNHLEISYMCVFKLNASYNILHQCYDVTFGEYLGSGTFSNVAYSKIGDYTYYSRISNSENISYEGDNIVINNGFNIDISPDIFCCNLSINNSSNFTLVSNADLNSIDINNLTLENTTPKHTIVIPETRGPLKVAQNSRGEIKIYNEADLIA